jgi:hypothetical protein
MALNLRRTPGDARTEAPTRRKFVMTTPGDQGDPRSFGTADRRHVRLIIVGSGPAGLTAAIPAGCVPSTAVAR